VVTRRPAETIVTEGGTSYIFVTEGTDAALVCAREAAGSDDVMVNGGADIARQYLATRADTFGVYSDANARCSEPPRRAA
jgi:dihydrofolate reductase